MDTSRRRLIMGSRRSRDETATNLAHYFDSFDSCYPLIASAGSLLIEEAQAMGIDTKGKSKKAVARELFSRGFTHPKDV